MQAALDENAYYPQISYKCLKLKTSTGGYSVIALKRNRVRMRAKLSSLVILLIGVYQVQ